MKVIETFIVAEATYPFTQSNVPVYVLRKVYHIEDEFVRDAYVIEIDGILTKISEKHFDELTKNPIK